MFLKKHFSKLEPKVKKLLAGVLSVAMIAGAVLAGISIKAGARSKTQDVLNELLGAAKPYGLVAEEFRNTNHNQTSFAVNTLHITDQYLSSWHDKSVGTTYVRDFDASSSSYMRVDTNAFNNLVLGSDYDYDAQENMYYIKDSNGVRTGAVVDVRNCRDIINVFYDRDYMDVTGARQSVGNTFEKYAQTSDDDADIVIKADDSKVIDLSGLENKQIVVVNMYARNYTDWQKNEVSEFYSLNDNFTIKNKANGQFVIINMLGGNADTSFYRFNVNGKGTGGLTDVDISDTVILNAVSVKGNIQIGELCGIVIAPYADVKLYNTCNGRVIAKTFENVSGQLHFVSDEQEEGTTSRETVSETSKSAESESTEIIKSSENASTETVKPTEEVTEVSKSGTDVTETTKSSENASTEAVKPTEKVTEASKSGTDVTETTKSAESASTEAVKPTEKVTEASKSGIDVTETTKSAESASTEVVKPTEKVTEASKSGIDVTETTKSAESASTEAVKPTEKESKTTGGMSETKTGEKETKPSHTISGSDYSGNNVTTGQVAADEEQVTRATKKGQVAADEDYVADGSNIKKTSDNSAMDSDSTVKNGKKAEVGADEDLVQTGDNKHIGIYIGILVAAVIVSGIVIAVNRKKSDK
ncbi:MAG TPA: hypothetical protein DCR83_07545 [Eubacterium sp.]|nr:hypothetical protein [Eubacterium sp.]HCO35264.1 hypothetical protein [Eubacterium sp.]